MGKRIVPSEDWLFLAERALRAASHLAEDIYPPENEESVGRCQRAVEKYLKGVITIFEKKEPPKIHDLPALCWMAAKHKPSLSNILPQCKTIWYLSNQAEYDRGISLSNDDMRLALKQTREVRSFLEKEVPELFQGSNTETHPDRATAEERGERKKALDIAKKLKARGTSASDIAEDTGLTADDISKL